MSKEDAIQLLKDSSYFHDAPPSLLEALADKMEVINADKGHVFVIEGEPMQNILVIEEGVLLRTKLSVPQHKRRASLEQIETVTQETLLGQSVVVDKIAGRGRVAGMLHSFTKTNSYGDGAFATVSAEGPCKVWMLGTDHFQACITQTPERSLYLLNLLAHELRVGSKSLRGLIQSAKGSGGRKSDKDVVRVMCYDTTSWVSDGFNRAIAEFNKTHDYELVMDYTTDRLSEQSAFYAAGYDAVCLFVNDTASDKVLQTLSKLDVKLVAMRCAGFDRVDTSAATAYNLTVARVPAYSPYAVAEMAVALLMAVNRKIALASARVKMANFKLDSSLMGMDIYGKTVAVMGTGKIGGILCKIVLGFEAKLVCYDVFESEEVKKMGGVYKSKEEIYKEADVIFMMMPLLKPTYHTINEESLSLMKKGVIIINTSRGGLIDTKALLKAIRSGIVSGVGMDVYENEADYFFQDWSGKNVQDPDLLALLGEPRVLLTAHQAFFTQEAVENIVSTTLRNIDDFHDGKTGAAHPNSCLPTK